MAKLLIKDGVTPPLLRIVAAVVNVGAEMTEVPNLVITSGTDGTHKVGSKHYSGAAIDLRSQNFPTRGVKLSFLERVRARLGPGYDLLLEGEGTANEHFHFEFDPK